MLRSYIDIFQRATFDIQYLLKKNAKSVWAKYALKALITHRESEVAFTKTISLKYFSKKRLVLKSRSINREVRFVSCCRVS